MASPTKMVYKKLGDHKLPIIKVTKKESNFGWILPTIIPMPSRAI